MANADVWGTNGPIGLPRPRSAPATAAIDASVVPDLDRLVAAVRRLTDAEFAAFLLTHEDHTVPLATDLVEHTTHQERADVDEQAGFATLVIDLDQYLPGADQVLNIPDFLTYDGVRDGPLGRYYPAITNLLRLPLQVDGAHLGELILANKPSEEGFTSEDQELAGAFAESAAAALGQVNVFRRERRAQQWIRAALETTRVLLGGEDRTEALRLVVRKIREVAGATYACAVLLDPDSPQRAVYFEGIDGLGLERFDGMPVSLQGLAAKTLMTGQATVSEDITHEEGYNPPPEVADDLAVLGPGMYVPLAVSGEVLGVIVVGWERGSPVDRVGPDEVALVEMFAGQAALALQHFQAKGLVLEDRARIGRDLRDVVIERLFAIGTRLEDTADLANKPEVRQRIDEALSAIDQTTRGVRAAIFQLRNPTLPDDRPTSEHLRDELDHARSLLGFTPRLVVKGPLDHRLSISLRRDLVRAIRKSVTDAAIYSRPSGIEVEVSLDEDQLRLTITDDGVDRTAFAGRDACRDLLTRVAQLGGSAVVRRVEPVGTRVTWQVPLTP
ncbi:sensor histidine kinase [Actinopolymorpha pittospori]|uniref:Signal transduction histidine kinase n=1 Tax=Actinopolymorpha pittospori TaxID=648752 RepID=A0A927N2N9_9ACTN|nr:GAF domain-containing protein [Actinopolymorpha pittospori]MBE1607495.1 signal transduction histidine kinase [Actinopolymorpha pittospori]